MHACARLAARATPCAHPMPCAAMHSTRPLLQLLMLIMLLLMVMLLPPTAAPLPRAPRAIHSHHIHFHGQAGLLLGGLRAGAVLAARGPRAAKVAQLHGEHAARGVVLLTRGASGLYTTLTAAQRVWHVRGLRGLGPRAEPDEARAKLAGAGTQAAATRPWPSCGAHLDQPPAIVARFDEDVCARGSSRGRSRLGGGVAPGRPRGPPRVR